VLAVPAPFPLANNGPIWAWVEYSGADSTLRVYLALDGVKPPEPLLRYSFSLGNFTFTDDAAYIGFTGATGNHTTEIVTIY